MSPLRDYLACQDRDLIVYVPSETCLNTVRVLILEAGHPEPLDSEIHGCFIELGTGKGVTVGDVAERVIQRRVHGIGEQATLFPV